MNFCWSVTLYEMAKGWRVVIKGGGRTVEGNGATVHSAYRAADCQLIYHPPFVPYEEEKPATDHCAHGNRKGDFCSGCQQERMG